VGLTATASPAPLEQNVFRGADEANRIENAFDGDLASTAGGVMWDDGQTVTIDLALDGEYDLEKVVAKAWYATSSSKGKVFQVKSLRLEGSSDGFQADTRTLVETTDTETHPDWGGEPRVPTAYVLPDLGAKATQLRLSIAPRMGDEVEGDAVASAIYLAEVEVWGNREGLAAEAKVATHQFPAVAAADIDGDGAEEVIAGSTNGKVFLLNADGSVRWSVETAGAVNTVATAAIADEGLAIIAGSMGGTVTALGSDGAVLWTWTAPYYKRAPHIRTVFPANLGGEKPAVIAGCDNWHYYALDAAGQELWHYESVHGSTAGAAADVDGDGVDEVACGTEYYWWHLVNAAGERVWNYSTSTGPTANACAIGDLDGDGKQEVLFGGADANVHTLDAAGTVLWHLNTGDEVTALACVDVDGDGAQEALVASMSFNLYAVKGDGTVLWRKDLGSPVLNMCVTGGKVCAATLDGHLYTLDMGTGDWVGSADLGAAGLSLAPAEGALKLVASVEDGNLYGFTW